MSLMTKAANHNVAATTARKHNDANRGLIRVEMPRRQIPVEGANQQDAGREGHHRDIPRARTGRASCGENRDDKAHQQHGAGHQVKRDEATHRDDGDG